MFELFKKKKSKSHLAMRVHHQTLKNSLITQWQGAGQF